VLRGLLAQPDSYEDVVFEDQRVSPISYQLAAGH
jgi:hypothetical protein